MFDHQTNRSRGFGFITFESSDTVEKIIERNDHCLMDKVVEVSRLKARGREREIEKERFREGNREISGKWGTEGVEDMQAAHRHLCDQRHRLEAFIYPSSLWETRHFSFLFIICSRHSKIFMQVVLCCRSRRPFRRETPGEPPRRTTT